MTNAPLTPQQIKFKSINQILMSQKAEIAKALPKHITADRMARIVLTCIRQNPKLLDCDPSSLFGAIIQASSLGLEPGMQGHAYLIPFHNKKKNIVECQFIPGYRGLIDLAIRSGKVKSLAAHVVKRNDHFEFELGLEEKLIHKPALSDRGEPIYVYAIAKLTTGGTQFEVMGMDEIDKIRRRARYDNNVWNTDFDEMARKTVVRRLCKYLPTSIEIREVLDQEDTNALGLSQGNQMVLDVEYVPEILPPDESQNEEKK